MNSKFILPLITLVTVTFLIAQICIVLNQTNNLLSNEDVDELSTLRFDNGTVSASTATASKTVTATTATATTTTAAPTSTLEPDNDKKEQSNQKPDGHFNGKPIHYQPYEEGWHSNVHCIGDNFGKDAWKYRSCHFQNYCFDMSNQSFVLFTSPEQLHLDTAIAKVEKDALTTPSFGNETTVSVGGINSKWGNDVKHIEWFPKLSSVDEMKKAGGHYTFSNEGTTLLFFHSLAGFNPGHLVWDDFLPIYTLLTMFQLLDKDLVLMRYKPVFWQWASCDRRWNSGRRKPFCKYMLGKFLPLLGQTLERMTTQENFNMVWSKDSSAITKKSKYICAPNGAAGLGMLTDHGSKLHGWKKTDYQSTQNIGRGGLLYDFRNWMLGNINIDPYQTISKPTYRIVFSIGSSTTTSRNVDFKNHIEKLKIGLGNKYNSKLDIRVVKMTSMSLKEQVELVAGASIMVTMCGGGAVTAMFLPKGASLFAFFNAKEKGGDTAPRLDWDILNNLGYLRVHWMPRPKKSSSSNETSEADYEAFVRMVDHELDIISHT